MALEQTNFVERSAGDEEPRNRVGAFRASGLTDVSRFLRPVDPVVTPLAPKNPLVGNYLDRALSGISSFGIPPTPSVRSIVPKAPIIVAENSVANERDANFTRFGTNFPTAAQVAAAKIEENEPAQRLSPVYQRRLERFAPVNYNASSTI
jgi:hypothetical protein